MKKFHSLWVPLLFLFLTFLILSPALPLRGSLGNIDWPIPAFQAQIKEISQSSLFVWNDKYLLTGIPTPNPPLIGWLITAGMGQLPISGELLSFINHFLLFFMMGYFSFLLLNYLINNKAAALAGAIFYMFSPPVFNWFHIGFIFLLSSYALLPLTLLLFIKSSIDKIKWNFVIFAALIYGIVGSIQTQSIFIWAMIFISYALFDIVKKRFSKGKILTYLQVFIGIFGISFLINFYWILQIIIGNSPITQNFTQQIAKTMLRMSSVDNMMQAFQLLGFHDPQYEKILKSFGLLGIFIPWIFTSFVWLSAIIGVNKKNIFHIGFFLIMYIISVSLTLGYNAPSPLDTVYGIFIQIPLLGILFRGSYKFWLIGGLSFAYLMTVTVCKMINLNKLLGSIIIIFLIIFSLLPYRYFIESQEPYRWPQEYERVNNWLEEQPGEFKAVYLPSETYIFLKDKKTHLIDFPNTTSPDTGRLCVGNNGITGNNYISYLSIAINESPTDSLGKLFGAEGIKYIIFQDNILAKSWETLSLKGPVEEIIKNKLNNQKDLKKLFTMGGLTVYENLSYQQQIYAISYPELVSGNFNYLLNSISFLPEAKDSSPIFLDSTVTQKNFNTIELLMNKEKANISLQDDSFIDLSLSLTDRIIEVPINQYVEGYFGDDKWGLVSNAYFFKNINYTASFFDPILAGTTEASNSGQLLIPFKTLADKGLDMSYQMLIKAYVGPKADKLSLSLVNPDNGKNIFDKLFQLNSQVEKGYRWFMVDDFPLSSFNRAPGSSWQIRLESIAGENSLERIVLIPQNEFLKVTAEAENLLSTKNLTISESGFNSKDIFIPLDGDYNISVKINDVEQNDNLILTIDANRLVIKNLDIDATRKIASSKVHLTKGNHRFTFSLESQPELLDNSSFELGLWSGALDSNPNVLTPPFIGAETSSLSTNGSKSLRIITSSSDHAAAVCQPFKNFQNTNLYKLSFDFKIEQLYSKPRYAIWQNLDNQTLPHWQSPDNVQARSWTVFGPQASLPTSNEWTTYAGIFEPFTNAQVAGICFFADPWGAKETANLYDNVKIEEIPFAPVWMTKVSPDESSAITTEPTVSFDKIDPTNYQVKISNANKPYILILLESFNEKWKLVSNNPEDTDINKQHFEINGFANAWYIDKNGDYTFNLQYTPQKYFIPSIVLSLLVCLGSIIYLILNFISQRRKDDNQNY